MTEKIDTVYTLIPPAQQSGGTTPQDAGTSQRSFSDLLAEADAVQDAVRLNRAAAPAARPFPQIVQPAPSAPLWWGPAVVPWLGGFFRHGKVSSSSRK
ncbi:MAG: hypothetical protein IID61_09500 [SAR324 cluster bacterium]|nr:hypothetical protein [SAR324 cluster bacterium]